LAPVDRLLGSDYVWTVFTGQKMFDNQGNIIAISTIFGWVITSIVTTGCSSTTTMHTAIDIDATALLGAGGCQPGILWETGGR